MAEEELTLIDEATESLERMQNFEVDSLVQEDTLGRKLSFTNAVPPAQKLVDLYRKLTTAALQDFPEKQLNQVLNQANHDFNLFDQILKFDTTQGNPHEARNALIAQLDTAYQAGCRAPNLPGSTSARR